MNKTITCINSISFSFLRPNLKNMCFMIHEILKYDNIFIMMEKIGKQYSQTPLKSPTMFRKYCVGAGEEGDLSLLQ